MIPEPFHNIRFFRKHNVTKSGLCTLQMLIWEYFVQSSSAHLCVLTTRHFWASFHDGLQCQTKQKGERIAFWIQSHLMSLIFAYTNQHQIQVNYRILNKKSGENRIPYTFCIPNTVPEKQKFMNTYQKICFMQSSVKLALLLPPTYFVYHNM